MRFLFWDKTSIIWRRYIYLSIAHSQHTMFLPRNTSVTS